ncbi:MAG: hypothetical protein GX550_07710, partial [Syntrophomonadaceae bacterium]|nr:hypothetical protein [Syntrophomonadaceae bacterium]
MESQNHGSNDGKLANGHQANLLGYVTSILIALLTIVTFGMAIYTPPLSGPYCSGPCFQYPFLDIASRFPRDYIWMYPAIALTILFVIWIVCIHQFATSDKKVFSQIGMALAAIAATILVSDYFVQISVIQPSILNGETDGIPVLT